MLYAQLIPEVQLLEGARELIADLKGEGCTVVLASSAKPEELDRYLDLLDARSLVDGWTGADDVERTKPAPDLVRAALDKAGTTKDAVLIGDSAWDCIAAAKAGVKSIAVRTGGFGADELLEAGAGAVFDSLVELRDRLPSTPFG